MKYDVTILTDHRYVAPEVINAYSNNVLTEDKLVQEALEKKGLTVFRTNWDNPDFDWSSTRFILFRTTWDYFDRYDEFSTWLKQVEKVTQLINPSELIEWNIDKHYLQDLQMKGIHIPPTIFIETKDSRSLSEILNETNWKEIILKPVISGAARHTYRFKKNETQDFENIFIELIQNESMIVQEFQEQIISKGEVAMMVFGGKYSHAVLKKAKSGDFRVQDDFGGTLHDYIPTADEIRMAEQCVKSCPVEPVYARVDILWDNQDNPALGELELIEPELWFRRDPDASDKLATAIREFIQ